MRKLELYVDDEYLFDIKADEAMIIDIPPNEKTIHGKMGGEWFDFFHWKKTNLLSLENIREGEQIKIEAYFSLWGALNPLSLVNRSMPIRLSRDEEEETTSYPSNPNL